MSDCLSLYTVTPTLVLQCERDFHSQNWLGEDIHMAEWCEALWYWSDREADK